MFCLTFHNVYESETVFDNFWPQKLPATIKTQPRQPCPEKVCLNPFRNQIIFSISRLIPWISKHHFSEFCWKHLIKTEVFPQVPRKSKSVQAGFFFSSRNPPQNTDNVILKTLLNISCWKFETFVLKIPKFLYTCKFYKKIFKMFIWKLKKLVSKPCR